jgi:hypothetical protein
MSPTRRIVAIPLFALALGLGLTSCGASTDGSSSSGEVMPAAGRDVGGAASASAGVAGGMADSNGAPAAAPDVAQKEAAPSAASGSQGSGQAAALPAPAAKLVKTADVVVEVKILKTAAAQVRSMAEGAGGTVASETTAYTDRIPVQAAGAADSTGTTTTGGDAAARRSAVLPGESVLVLRVPVASMDATIERVASVGKELSRTSSAVDVTADLADLGSRVKTQESSVARVRALLAKAASLQEIVMLESELTRREADLEALQARQASLAGRADLSTLTVTLRTPDVASPDPQPADDDNSFVGGLKRGWHAVVVSTGVVLTILGALLPLLVVAAVIAVPVWWVLRRRTARRRPSTGPVSAPAGPPAGPAGPPSGPVTTPTGPAAPPTAPPARPAP